MSGKASEFERFVGHLSTLFMYISMGMLLIMMLLGTSDVVGRYFFDKPISGTFEITEILLAGVVFFGLAYTQRMKGHVAIALVYNHFPNKLKSFVNLFNSLVLIFIFALISWRGIVTAIIQWEEHREISNLGWPHFLFQLFVPVGSVTICLVFIAQMLQSITQRSGGD